MSGASSFDGRVKAVRPRLLKFCYRLTGSFSDAEDLAQEALISAWSKDASYCSHNAVNPESFFRFCCQQAIDSWWDQNNRAKKSVPTVPLSEADVDGWPDLEGQAVSDLTVRAFLAKVDQRAMTILRAVLAGLSYREAAALAGVTERTAHKVRSRLRPLAEAMLRP